MHAKSKSETLLTFPELPETSLIMKSLFLKVFPNNKCKQYQRASACTGWPFAFYSALLILTLLSLYPIWMNRLLPMQDYPQHLFLSHVIATYDNPDYNWKEFYTVNLGLRPYHLWYLAMKPLSMLYGVEIAGKLLFSIYVLMLTVLVLISQRLCPKNELPWGALIIYPFAFNQIYFMGFPNFIISLPVLYLAVIDLEEIANGDFMPWRYWLHAFYLAILYLNHPYTLLVYICLAISVAICCLDRLKTIIKILFPAIAASSILALWYLLQHGPSTAANPYVWHITWLPVNYSLVFYLLMFTGMRLTNGPDPVSLTAWTTVFFIVYYAWRISSRNRQSLMIPSLLFAVSLIGYFVLPAWFGYYSYFNLRLAPVSYFLLALLFAHLPIKPRAGLFVAILSIIIVISSIRTQTDISRTTEEILPLIEKTDKNALILPLIFNGGTNIIEPVFFYQFHLHEFNYYHVVKGGGANPTLFRNAMIPVQYRLDIRLPYPTHPEQFTWTEHGRFYRNFILRGAPAEFSRQLLLHCDLIARSGPWELYQAKTKGNRDNHDKSL